MDPNSHFQICVKTHFSAAHHLRGYPGACEKPHGHNWTVGVHVRCNKLTDLGITVDFYDIQTALEETLKDLNHNDLNTLSPFQDQNPSSENIARHLYRELRPMLQTPGLRLSKVSVSETPNFTVEYWEE